MNIYKDYDELVQLYQSGKIGAAEFVTGQSDQTTAEYRQFCSERRLAYGDDSSALDFLAHISTLLESSSEL